MLPASLHLLLVVKHVLDHISNQLAWSKWFCVLVFFQVLPCSACPSAAVTSPDHTLAPLPNPTKEKVKHVPPGQSSTGQSPYHYKFALSQKTGMAVATSCKRDYNFTCRQLQAKNTYCSSTYLQPHRVLNQNLFQVNMN